MEHKGYRVFAVFSAMLLAVLLVFGQKWTFGSSEPAKILIGIAAFLLLWALLRFAQKGRDHAQIYDRADLPVQRSRRTVFIVGILLIVTGIFLFVVEIHNAPQIWPLSYLPEFDLVLAFLIGGAIFLFTGLRKNADSNSQKGE